MDTVRTAALIAHLVGVAGLVVALCLAVAPRARSWATRGVVLSGAFSGLTGLALIGARAALDLSINGPKLAVKAIILIAIIVLANRLRSTTRQLQPAGAAIAALVAANVAIAVAWN